MTDLDDLRGPECRVCGASIEHRRSDASYCSDQCYRLEYHQFEKDARLASKANRPPCRTCGTTIPVEAQARRIFCSQACGKVASNQRTRERLARPCQVCGKTISTTHAGQKYCSRRCLYKAQKILRPRTCRPCGKRFTPRKAKQQYCCHECAGIARRTAIKRKTGR